jgi:hypothetical protein
MDIDVNITDGTPSVSQESFGIVKVFAEEEQFNVKVAGGGASDKGSLVFVSASRGLDATITIVSSGSSIGFGVSGSDVTLTVPTTGATAKQVKQYFDDNSLASVKAKIGQVLLLNSGSGPVATLAQASLAGWADKTLLSADDVADLLPYYATTDQTYIMAAQLFGQDFAPEKVYIQNAYDESPTDSFATRIAASDNNDFYFLLLTEYADEDLQIEAGNWADLNKRILVVLNTETDILTEFADNGYTAGAIVTSGNVSTRPDAAAVGAQASKTPGSTDWDWLRLNGITAETDTDLIAEVVTKKGNIVTKLSGVTFFGPGRMTGGLFIDQRHSRDYMEARIRERFVGLMTSVEKIPYDDGGIATLVSTLSDQLNAFGDDGIIARAIAQDEVAASYNGRYQYSINAPTRGQVVANNPSWIANRTYELTFDFVEAGAIGDVTITGRVVLKLAAA